MGTKKKKKRHGAITRNTNKKIKLNQVISWTLILQKLCNYKIQLISGKL